MALCTKQYKVIEFTTNNQTNKAHLLNPLSCYFIFFRLDFPVKKIFLWAELLDSWKIRFQRDYVKIVQIIFFFLIYFLPNLAITKVTSQATLTQDRRMFERLGV